MTREILTNQTLPIGEVGNWFVITNKNNINGSIIFSDNDGHTKIYPLHKYDRKEFNISEMVNNKWVSFVPLFVEFRTYDDVETIIIDVAFLNP